MKDREALAGLGLALARLRERLCASRTLRRGSGLIAWSPRGWAFVEFRWLLVAVRLLDPSYIALRAVLHSAPFRAAEEWRVILLPWA